MSRLDRTEIMSRYEARVLEFDRAARRADARAVRAPDPVPAVKEVTARELEVLELIAHGHENRSIARQLFLSEETVKTYVRSLLAKLSARNRAHAVAIGLRTGVIEGMADARPAVSA